MFRWKKLPGDVWVGVDGPRWYRISRDFQIESNGSQEDFERFFRLDWDASAVAQEIRRRGPELEPYLGELRGLRVMRPSSPVETFFSFLCTANNNLSRIVPMCWALGRFGTYMAEVEGITLHEFPSVETIANIPEEELRKQGFGYRGATIPEVARQVLERGPNWISSLRERPYEEAHAALVEIKGIGPKLADCICLFALDKTEAVPLDTHIWQAFTRLYHPEWRGTAVTGAKYKEATQRFRERFGAYAGWAHQYLFYENLLNWRRR